MRFFAKKISYITEALFLLFVFIFSQLPLTDYDIWFHLKSGELFVKSSHLYFTDPFSFTAFGKPWIPYEWLFQVGAYLLSKIGLWIIPYFISIFTVIFFFFFIRILSYIFRVNKLVALAASIMLFAWTMEFFTARPQVIAYAFISFTLFLILSKIYKNKNWILITPLVTLIWANLHSTAFLAWGLTICFALVTLIQYFLTRKKEYFQATKTLSIVSGVNFIATILPPLGFLDYKLLWDFYQDRVFLGHFISEWEPLFADSQQLIIYVLAVVVVLLLFLFVTWKKKYWSANLWVIPFAVILLVGFTAQRNVPLAAFALFIIFGYAVWEFLKLFEKTKLKYIFFTIIALLTVFFAQQWYQKRIDFFAQQFYYPDKAVKFAKNYLAGNMFNEYSYGGYVLYNIYPTQKVFIDGRTDIYRTTVMRDYLELSTKKNLSDSAYIKFLDSFWDKYHISYAIISTTKNSVMRRIGRLLNTDPTWTLVFWDDVSQVFVRNNGENSATIAKFGTYAATPYLKDPYIMGKQAQALAEYQRMEQVAPSSHSLNAIGYIYLQQKKYNQANQVFLHAIGVYPNYESPYMNLAELSAKDGDLDSAISLYQKAQSLAPNRGLVYIRLGQLLLQRDQNIDEAKQIWQEGVKNTEDDQTRGELENLINQ